MPPLTIGPLTLASPVLLAPMAGYTDLPFRLCLRSYGRLGLAYTELINPHSLLRGGGRRRAQLLATEAEDAPLGWQIYGSDVEMLCEAARALEGQGAPLIDVNMGCPERKISGGGAGAGWLRTPAAAVAAAARVVAAVKIPVTVKLRLGWDATALVAAGMLPGLEDAGVAAVTVHGRTRTQAYTGQADLEAIRSCVAAARRMPVIGNGDIVSVASARQMLAVTGCAGLMVGRGALARPWLIRDIARDLAGEAAEPTDERAGRIAFLAMHLDRMLAFYGSEGGVRLFRKWIPQYVRGLVPHRRDLPALFQIAEESALREALAGLTGSRGN